MSGERFPSVGGREIEGQVTFDDLEAEKENSQNLAGDGAENIEKAEEKSPRDLAIEKIQNAEELDDLRELAPELEAQFGDTDKELDAIFKKRIEAIRVRNRVVTSIPFYKKHENLVERYNLTKDNPDFTEDDKTQIYKAIKRKLEAEGWTGSNASARTESDIREESVNEQGVMTDEAEANTGEEVKNQNDQEDFDKKLAEIRDNTNKEFDVILERTNKELDGLEKRVNALFTDETKNVGAAEPGKIEKLEAEEAADKEAMHAAMAEYTKRRDERAAEISRLREKIEQIEAEEATDKKAAKALCGQWKARQKERMDKIEALKKDSDSGSQRIAHDSFNGGKIVGENVNNSEVVVNGSIENEETVVDGVVPEKDKKKEYVPGTDEFIGSLEKFVEINERTSFDDVKKRAEKLYNADSWDSERWGRFIDRVETRFFEIRKEKEETEWGPFREAVIKGLEEYLNGSDDDQPSDEINSGNATSQDENKGTDKEKKNVFEPEREGYAAEASPKSEEMPLEEALEKCPDSYTFARLVQLDEENLDLYLGKLKEKFPESQSSLGSERKLRNRFIIKFGEDYNEEKVGFKSEEDYHKSKKYFVQRFRHDSAEMGSVIKAINGLDAEDLEGVPIDTIRSSLEYYYYMACGGKIKVYQGKEARDDSALVGHSDEMRKKIQGYAIERYKQLGLDFGGKKLNEEEIPRNGRWRKRIGHWLVGLDLRRRLKNI